MSVSENAPAAHSTYSPSEWPATHSALSASTIPKSFSSTRAVATELAMIAGCALAVMVSSLSGPSFINADSLPSASSTPSNTSRACALAWRVRRPCRPSGCPTGKDSAVIDISRGCPSSWPRAQARRGHRQQRRARCRAAEIGNAAARAPTQRWRPRPFRGSAFRHVADRPRRSPAMPFRCCVT